MGSLPLVTDAAAVRKALGFGMAERVELVQWLADRESGLFYGSAFVRMSAVAHAAEAVEAAATKSGLVLRGRKLNVAFSPPREGEVWPPKGYTERERPPVG